MLEQFIPYPQALKLKELGFDEECLGAWNRNGEFLRCSSTFWDLKSLKILESYFGEGSHECLAPLWQQAFDWFREKYKIFSFIDIDFSYRIYCDNKNRNSDIDSESFVTYKEARLECLNKLIELAEDETN